MRDAEIKMPLQDDLVYGPIESRRLGYSLGINPLPLTFKLCNFDCVYCQYGWTPKKGSGEKVLRAPEMLSKIRAELTRHKEEKTLIDFITIAGNGEPTLHPDFPQIVDGLVGLRDELFPSVKIAILSDSSQVHKKTVRQALDRLDERFMKLDGGTPEMVRLINRPRGDFDFNRMVRELAAMRAIVIQTLFVRGSYDNSTDRAVKSWIKVIKKILPKEVQVYTIDRKPADPGLQRVEFERLEAIADECQAATGVSCVVYD